MTAWSKPCRAHGGDHARGNAEHDGEQHGTERQLDRGRKQREEFLVE
jgi:hypothetical protein